MDVKAALNQFMHGSGNKGDKNKGRYPCERYASFDYCYNYFYSFYERRKIHELAHKRNIQMSCLHLGFYLASWGMMRGSSFLPKKSVKHLEPVIREISKMDRKLWEIDVGDYSQQNIGLLLKCKNQISEALGEDNNPTDTLVTKIMLGVFSNIPAFDRNFKKSIKVGKVNKKSLEKIKSIYKKYKSDFDSFPPIYTYDFKTGENTKIRYNKAKLIDMYGFIKGKPKKKS